MFKPIKAARPAHATSTPSSPALQTTSFFPQSSTPQSKDSGSEHDAFLLKLRATDDLVLVLLMKD